MRDVLSAADKAVVFFCNISFSHPERLCVVSSLQVKKTTQPWFGSGFIRASPSAARPADPTTNWWPTSSPTNSSIPLFS